LRVDCFQCGLKLVWMVSMVYKNGNFRNIDGFRLELVNILGHVCDGIGVIKHGMTAAGKQRYRCQNPDCERGTLIQDYSYVAYSVQEKQQISEMALNGSTLSRNSVDVHWASCHAYETGDDHRADIP